MSAGVVGQFVVSKDLAHFFFLLGEGATVVVISPTVTEGLRALKIIHTVRVQLGKARLVFRADTHAQGAEALMSNVIHRSEVCDIGVADVELTQIGAGGEHADVF